MAWKQLGWNFWWIEFVVFYPKFLVLNSGQARSRLCNLLLTFWKLESVRPLDSVYGSCILLTIMNVVRSEFIMCEKSTQWSHYVFASDSVAQMGHYVSARCLWYIYKRVRSWQSKWILYHWKSCFTLLSLPNVNTAFVALLIQCGVLFIVCLNTCCSHFWP